MITIMSSWNISWPQNCPYPCPIPMCISYVEHNGWPPFHELLVMAFNTLTNFYKCYHFLGFWQCIPPAPCTVSHRYKYFWPSSHCQPSLDEGSRFCMGWGQRERDSGVIYFEPGLSGVGESSASGYGGPAPSPRWFLIIFEILLR